MKSVMYLGLNLFFFSACGVAAEVFVGQHESAELNAAGNAEFSGRMVIADEGAVVKTGQGTQTVSSVSVDQSWPVSFTVLEGSLALEADGAPAATLPDVMEDAAIWVSASDSDETHFVASGNGLYQWYDVRETDVSAPKRLYARASTVFTKDYPERVTTNGYASVWFGGVSSGRTMDWYWPAGSRFKEKTVKHVFAVHGVLSSYGPVFSTGSDSPNVVGAYVTYAGNHGNNHDSTLHAGYFLRSINVPCIWNGRTWIDGVRTDPLDVPDVAKGFHLLEVDAAQWGYSMTGGFYSQRNKETYSGGDFLCEAVAFTNVLTEAERVQVGAYLMKKWFGSAAPKSRISVAEGASASISSGTGACAEISGSGSLVKRGAGNVVLRSSDSSAASSAGFTGDIEIEEGCVTMGTSWPIAVKAGDRVSSEVSAQGRRIGVTRDAAADSFVKDGEDELVVQKIPSAVRKIAVEDGRLVLRQRSAARSAAWTKPYGTVLNGDFEGFDESHFTTVPFTLPRTSTNGWHSFSGSNAYVVNWDMWTQSFAGGTKAQFQFVTPPETGDCVLFMNAGGKVYGNVEIPETGRWEILFKLHGRKSDSYFGSYVDVELLASASSSSVSADFGRAMCCDLDKRWKKVSLSADVQAGSYCLRLSAAGGGSLLVDDLELRQVAPETSWPVPGGDFESASIKRCGTGYYTVTPKEAMNFTYENAMEGWTFSGDPDSPLNPPVGLVTAAMTNAYGVSTHSGCGTLYNDSRQPRGGFVEVFFKDDQAELSTSFTPPEGTWLLRVDAAHRYDTAGTLEAVAVIGGETVSLGTVVVDKRAMTALTFPKPVTVDGSQSVALRVIGHLGSDKSGIWVDDFRLVTPRDRGEMIADGGFEDGVSRWTIAGTCRTYNYPANSQVYGTDAAEGTRFVTIRGRASVWQDVEFPAAGLYRIAFSQHTRLTERSTHGENPLTAYVAREGVTNVIGTALVVSHTNFVQNAFDFRVDSPGTYTVGLKGTASESQYETVLDAVSLMPVTSATEQLEIPDGFELSVDEGAKVRFDFDGTRPVKVVRLGGRRVTGIIDASLYPQYVEGRGALEAPVQGTVILFR